MALISPFYSQFHIETTIGQRPTRAPRISENEKSYILLLTGPFKTSGIQLAMDSDIQIRLEIEMKSLPSVRHGEVVKFMLAIKFYIIIFRLHALPLMESSFFFTLSTF